jgi:signal transduction histidine kinase
LDTRPSRRWFVISYSAFYLILAAVAVRALLILERPENIQITIGMMALYLLLLIATPALITRRVAFLHLINTVQIGITLTLLLKVGQFDFFSMLFITPCALSMLNFPRRVALIWIGAISLVMSAALLIHFPFEESLSYVITYVAAIVLSAGLCYLAMEAEEERCRSQKLLVDLQEANQKLRVYSQQVQELAAAEERNRLARELHDSVTQIIFGLTLSAQAARILLDRDPAKVAVQLDHMQVLAKNALGEMRALIQQLHPSSAAEDGLAAGLRRLAKERQASDGLYVDLKINGEQHLSPKIEEALMRVAGEALNNIVKHARTSQAAIILNLGNRDRITLCIEDNGVGFDPAKARSQKGHLGLTSMYERIRALGGTISIDSKPGKGTTMRVELELGQEVKHG